MTSGQSGRIANRIARKSDRAIGHRLNRNPVVLTTCRTQLVVPHGLATLHELGVDPDVPGSVVRLVASGPEFRVIECPTAESWVDVFLWIGEIRVAK